MADDDLTNSEYLALIWISLSCLLLQIFHPDLLRPTSSFGTLLAMDLPTITLARPSEAHFCVELDIRSPTPSTIWIGSSTGFFQEVWYHKFLAYRPTRLGLAPALVAALVSSDVSPSVVSLPRRCWCPLLPNGLDSFELVSPLARSAPLLMGRSASRPPAGHLAALPPARLSSPMSSGARSASLALPRWVALAFASLADV